jgi:RNA polymerase sigma-70 factor (ECF subfamily)
VTDLSARFLPKLDDASRPRFQAIADLEVRLRRLIDLARAAYPEVPCDEAELVDALAARAGADLDALHIADIHLAVACMRGEPAAITAFDRTFSAELDGALARNPRLTASKDEFRQLVRTRLFSRERDRPARITTYSGQGPLRAWVRVTCARVVLELSRTYDGHK